MPPRLIRLSLRFVLPLALVLALFAYAVVPLADNLTQRWFMRDLESRAESLAAALQDPLRTYVPQQELQRIRQLFEGALRDENLKALGWCAPDGTLGVGTAGFPGTIACAGAQSDAQASGVQGQYHVTYSSVAQEGRSLGQLVLVHDIGYIEERSAAMRRYLLLLFALLVVVTSATAVLVGHLSWRNWVDGSKRLLRGAFGRRSTVAESTPPEVSPLETDLRSLLREYHLERNKREDAHHLWTPQKLRTLLHEELAGDEVLVVSNREPYLHMRTRKGIEVQRPASGLVTAVEPVMRACSGTWIAHGSGSADREAVDADDRVPVPPSSPAYTLRRVWLSDEEEKGYYYGFANEGLWPLCHIAHVRPVFRSSDWAQYEAVNRRFADAVVKEARTDDPVVLVQDYHFALLPRMVREALPKATIITFWHIPWPNPESFGICPWREEILDGLLGSTILGFHTPFHCKNFLETVDRYLETRIEHETSTISYGGELTQVQDYPISIAWPEGAPQPERVLEARASIRAELGLASDHLLAIGVDRFDYTKGIIERMQAVERMLEQHPSLVGRFTLIQIAAPTRSSLEEYQNFEARVRAHVRRINGRFGSGKHVPVLLKAEHHGAEQVAGYYRAADVCMVTSLHDGMNLVAKEFIAAREDERGVLLLSQFTGAARELHEALIVNPYHIEQSAEALYRALMMPESEQCERMRSMRALVRDFNIYRWAGHMLLDAARLRQRERIMTRIRSHSRKSLRRVV